MSPTPPLDTGAPSTHTVPDLRAVRRRASGLIGSVTAASLIGFAALSAVPAQAATTFTLANLSATVTGTSVIASTTVKASVKTTARQYGVCVRSASGANLDFPKVTNKVISTTGTAFRSTAKQFTAGTYKYYACVLVGSTWYKVGSSKSFTVLTAAATAVPSTTTSPTPTPSTSTPSTTNSAVMPTGDLPGWKQTFTEDFATDVPLGGFTSSPAYKSRWHAYTGPDTTKKGVYQPNSVLSVSNSALDWNVHTANGQHNVGAVVPLREGGQWGGQTHGRFSFRFRSEVIPGYKLAFMLWPDSNNWAEGEVDFPEVISLDADSNIYGNLYERGNLASGVPGASRLHRTQTPAAGNGWHVATIEWTPGKLTYILDGQEVGTYTSGVPTTPFHLVFQVETAVNEPMSNSTAGHVQLDWVTQYSYTG